MRFTRRRKHKTPEEARTDYLRQLAKVKFKGTPGMTIYISGLTTDNTAAIAEAASYALRYKKGAQ